MVHKDDGSISFMSCQPRVIDRQNGRPSNSHIKLKRLLSEMFYLIKSIRFTCGYLLHKQPPVTLFFFLLGNPLRKSRPFEDLLDPYLKSSQASSRSKYFFKCQPPTRLLKSSSFGIYSVCRCPRDTNERPHFKITKTYPKYLLYIRIRSRFKGNLGSCCSFFSLNTEWSLKLLWKMDLLRVGKTLI